MREKKIDNRKAQLNSFDLPVSHYGQLEMTNPNTSFMAYFRFSPRILRSTLALFVVGLLFAPVGFSAEGGGKDFHDQDLTGKIFKGAVLNRANFSDAVLISADFTEASLKGANFSGAQLNNTAFARADLTGADLRGSIGTGYWEGANFSKANMENLEFKPHFQAKFRGANLKGAKITGSTGANDFSNADLRGANLRGLTISGYGNNFKGAIYDDDTAFPDGFEPETVGMVLKNSETKPESQAGVDERNGDDRP